jgi:xylulokinase
MALVMGVDSSTQATKVEVRDADTGGLVASARAVHAPTTPPRSEQHPHDWWTAFETACAHVGDVAAQVGAISVAGQQHGMVVLDAAGEVVRPAKLWNDTESAPDAQRLIDEWGGAAAWAAACGSVPVAAFTITKLAWLRRSEPKAWARVAHVLLPHDWLTYRLTGERVTDRGDASGTGYWSAREERWRLDLLAQVDRDRDWSPALPRVLDPREPAGTSTTWAIGAIVGPGTGDNMAAALGLGLQGGDVAVSIGTSGTVFTRSSVATADPTGAVAGFADATGAYLPLVCTLNAAKVTDTVARLLGVDATELDDLALADDPTDAETDGVVLVPYFDGERTPNRPRATGTLAGLRTDVTREQVARAAFAGVVCGLLDGLDALARAGVPLDADELVLTGGGANSRAYPQVLANLSGRRVAVARDAQYVARGACVQAAAVLHGCPIDDVTQAWKPEQRLVVEPRIGSDRARQARERYAQAAAEAGEVADPGN